MNTNEESVNLKTSGTNWQDWSIRLPLSVASLLVFGLWQGFNIHNKIHENEANVERIESRLDKITKRLEDRIEELEDALKCD